MTQRLEEPKSARPLGGVPPSLSFARRVYARLREILWMAPWSSLDLLSGSVVFWIGIYWSLSPESVSEFSATMPLHGWMLAWIGAFIGCGLVGIGMTLWPSKPSFVMRLGSRMGVTFCLLSLAASGALHDPPLLSSITNGVLAVSSLWSIGRTKTSGR